jgi:arylsulfatase A-like enzyme
MSYLAHDSNERDPLTQRDQPLMGAASDRRTFLKSGLALGGSLALARAGLTQQQARGAARQASSSIPGLSRRPPNILVILVDQMRSPVWTAPAALVDEVMPNLAALRRRSVSFERHYTASNDCSPARSTLLTGLHTHQTGCMITGRSRLDPGLPTWGVMLADMGYSTSWWGKWHLNPRANASLAPYGFSGGTYPSPNGSPGQGTEVDPQIALQFGEWFTENGGGQPWCTTVSFVNPHDVAWWYRFTSEIPSESSPSPLVGQLPGNFETPQQLAERSKPALQRSLQDTAARSFGAVPFSGEQLVSSWSSLINTYLMLHGNVDRQIAAVLRGLHSQPKVAANTVIVFTSDHGEYGGSHGLRGKGASAYEEAIRVPLYVHDPREQVTKHTAIPRRQLTSSVDVAPLLLSIATGSEDWRSEPLYSHLAERGNLAGICADPSLSGRPWILHATDEDVTEFASELYAAEAPRHVVALRTARGKLALYNNWTPGTVELEGTGEESELYDYSTTAGRAELQNDAGSSALEEELRETLQDEAIPRELHAPLPLNLSEAGARGLADYQRVEEYEQQQVEDSHLPSISKQSAEAAPTPDSLSRIND